LGSGKGSNLAAIADAVAAGQVPAEIALVISDVPGAGILQQAEARRIPARYLPPGPFRTKLDEPAECAYRDALQQAEVDLVVLAGFMRIIKGPILQAYPRRIINIHPSLLPSFPGLQAWRQALDYGVRWTGCTVHFVDEGVDSGPIIAQRTVPVLSEDTPESLHARIQIAEREVYPAVVRMLAEHSLTVEGRRVLQNGRAGHD
jgi:phosphoribosylglycinamide formyltransferase-1